MSKTEITTNKITMMPNRRASRREVAVVSFIVYRRLMQARGW